MAIKDKRVFVVDGKEYAVRKPTMQELANATKIRNETFNDELHSGSMLRSELEGELRKRNMWNDEREARYQELRINIINAEYRLAKGGIKLADAKKIALQMRKDRQEMSRMLSERTDLDSNTCEGRADAARFNYLLSQCLVYNSDGSPYFPKGLEDYLLKQNDPVANTGATEFFYLMSNLDQVDEKLAENKFLKKFKFVNDEYSLIDKDGRLVDEEGRHIDKNGLFIKWISEDKYVHVDIEGREVNDEGDFVCDQNPFLDDDGNPIIIDEPEEDKAEDKVESKVESKVETTEKRTSEDTQEVE